jgi:hypothetical protein
VCRCGDDPDDLSYYPVVVDPSDFDLIFAALDAEKVRYLVVGGVAVVLHGVPRFTADLDLLLALDAANVRAAIAALARLGYRPRAPVPVEGLADPVVREQWIDEKGLTVFTLWSPEHPATEVDIFVDEPIPFDDAYGRAARADLGAVTVHVVSVQDLIELKRRAGRPRDLEDIAALAALARDGDGHE